MPQVSWTAGGDVMSELSGVAGDTLTITLDVLRHWVAVLIVTAEETDTALALSAFDDIEVGDTLQVGDEVRVITGLGEGLASFDDPLTEGHPIGAPVHGVGVVDLDSAQVTFRFAEVEKAVTISDPDTGAAVVVLDPADTADLAPYSRVSFPWELRAVYPSQAVVTLARGRIAIVPDVPTP